MQCEGGDQRQWWCGTRGEGATVGALCGGCTSSLGWRSGALAFEQCRDYVGGARRRTTLVEWRCASRKLRSSAAECQCSENCDQVCW